MNFKKSDPANLNAEKLRFSNRDKIQFTAWLTFGIVMELVALVFVAKTYCLASTPFGWIPGVCAFAALLVAFIIFSTVWEIAHGK